MSREVKLVYSEDFFSDNIAPAIYGLLRSMYNITPITIRIEHIPSLRKSTTSFFVKDLDANKLPQTGELENMLQNNKINLISLSIEKS